MATKNSKSNEVRKSENKNAAKQQVSNANGTRRVVETRELYEVIFNHSVTLITAYCRNQKPSDPRSGFGFGPTADQPHSRAYAKSLIWGFATNRAGKVLKNFKGIDKVLQDFEGLDTAQVREKIAIAILSDCKLVKGDSEAIKAQLNKVEPKREAAIAKSVLDELTKPTKPTTPKGGKGKAKAEPKKTTAPKGSKAKSKK
jgi:hypothetical protein